MNRWLPKNSRRLTAALIAATLTAACSEPLPPTPPLQRDVQERPVYTLPAPAAARPHLTVPAAALVQRGGMPGVMVLGDGGVARFRLVKPGTAKGESVEILAGLFGGERIVMGNLEAIRDGTPITIQD